MTTANGYQAIIHTSEELRKGKLWVITSDNLPGLLLAGKDLRKLRADIPEVIKKLFLLNYDMAVDVTCLVQPADLRQAAGKNPPRRVEAWAAVPAGA